MTRTRHLVLSVILLAPAVACLGPNGPLILPPGSVPLVPGEFIYLAQSFECEVDKEAASARITQAIILRCTDGCIEGIRVVIPYGGEEIPQSDSGSLEALTEEGNPLTRRVDQNQSHTEVRVELAPPLCEGQDTAIVLGYTIHDLPGREGITRPVLSLLDRLLGRDPSRFRIMYRPSVFEGEVQELVVRISPALDMLPRRWEPGCCSTKLYDPETGHVSINWQIREDVPRAPLYSMLVARDTGPDYTPMLLAVLVLSILVILIGATLLRSRSRGMTS